MAAGMEMTRRVTVLGGVATTDVAAGQAQSQMHPGVAVAQAATSYAAPLS